MRARFDTKCLLGALALLACGDPEPAASSATGGAPGAGGSVAAGGGASGAGAGESTAGGGASNAGASAGGGAGGSTSSAGSAGSSGGNVSVGIVDTAAPSVTFTEFDIPTPSDPGWIAAGPDGNLWFTHQSTAPSAIGNLTPQGDGFNLYNTSTTNTGPQALTAGPDGNVWYSKQGGIGRMTPSGQMNEYGVPNGGDSGGMVQGPDGNLWFTQPLHNRISRVTTSAEFEEFTIPTADSGPLAIAVGPDGNLWFTEAAAVANKIGRVTPAGEFSEFPIPTAASHPTGITPGPDGNLWFTERDGRKIGSITPEGVITEFALPSGNSPSRIVAGPDGNLWFTVSGSANTIGRITPAGAVAEYTIPTEASDPYDITLGPDDNLWFTEISANKIARISNLSGGGDVGPTTPGEGGGELGGDTPCTVDSDCVESGKACGGDVCGADKVCVLAVSADPGTCVSDDDCWCKGQGASCADGHCSFTYGSGP